MGNRFLSIFWVLAFGRPYLQKVQFWIPKNLNEKFDNFRKNFLGDFDFYWKISIFDKKKLDIWPTISLLQQNFGTNFGQNFTRNLTWNFNQNFGPNFNQNFGPNFNQNFGPNFSQKFSRNFTRNFTRNCTRNFTRNFCENFSRKSWNFANTFLYYEKIICLTQISTFVQTFEKKNLDKILFCKKPQKFFWPLGCYDKSVKKSTQDRFFL